MKKNEKDPLFLADWEKQIMPLPNEADYNELFIRASIASNRAAQRFPEPNLESNQPTEDGH